MKTTDYKAGMLVDHPNRPLWGPGKIVHVEGTRVYVFFRDDLERKAKSILCAIVPLTIAASQSDAVLDELPAATQEDGAWLLPARYGKQTDEPSTPKKKGKRTPPAPIVAA